MKKLKLLLIIGLMFIVMSSFASAWCNTTKCNSSWNFRKPIVFLNTSRTYEPNFLNLTEVCGADDCLPYYLDARITMINSTGSELDVSYEFLNESYRQGLADATNYWAHFIANDTSLDYFVYYNYENAGSVETEIFHFYDSFEDTGNTTSWYRWTISTGGRLLQTLGVKSRTGKRSITHQAGTNAQIWEDGMNLGTTEIWMESMFYMNVALASLDPYPDYNYMRINDQSGGTEVKEDVGLHLTSPGKGNAEYFCRVSIYDAKDTGIEIEPYKWYSFLMKLNSTDNIFYINGIRVGNCSGVGRFYTPSEVIQTRVCTASTPNQVYIDDVRVSKYRFQSYPTANVITFDDTTPPTNSTWNVTSLNLPSGESSTIWNLGGQYVINVTNNTGSITVVTEEESNGSCAIGKNWNYTTMVADNINYKFATTETTDHSYLVYDDIPIGSSCLYCSFIDSSGNEFANSSSGCLNITRTTPITGYVQDSLSNLIEGAIVYITNLFTNVTEKVTTNVSGMYESSQGYEKGIHLISGYDPSNYSLQPDAQLVNVTE